MTYNRKILVSALTLSYLTLASSFLYAQNKVISTDQPQLRHKSRITLGFQSGKEISLIKPKPSLPSGSRSCNAVNGAFFLRKPLSPHFKIETALSYSVFQSDLISGTAAGKYQQGHPQNSVTIPVTIQYYFLPQRYKLHPYCGTGIVCGCNNPYTNTRNSSDAPIAPNQSDTKYISILFTQGVTFEINTKIEISQSFHFIPGNETRTLGIDLGIGYKIP